MKRISAKIAALVLVALVCAALVLAGFGPWRYTVAAVARSQNAEAVAYVVDTWTGRVRVWLDDEEQFSETLQERREAVEQAINFAVANGYLSPEEPRRGARVAIVAALVTVALALAVGAALVVRSACRRRL